MNSVCRLLSCLVALLLIASQARAEDKVEHVVVICVDGLPASLLNHPAIPLTAIHKLAGAGVIAKGMTPSNPSVTWPNHTTLITGARPADHGVLFNGVLERPGLGLPVQINPRTDRSELVRIPTLPDVLHAQGRKVVGINWPCTRNSDSYFIDFPDSPDTMRHTTPFFIDEMIQAGIVPADVKTSFGKLPALARDEIWTEAACLALRTHKPALTLLHLLNLDATHHRYGPETLAGNTAAAYADSRVEKVLQTLDEAGMRPTTAVLIVSDHGFMGIPKTIHPNVALRKAGLLTVELDRITAASVHAVPEGGIAMIYLTRPDTRDADRGKVFELFEKAEGIQEILSPDRFAEFGFPQPDEYAQMADLVLVAKDGYGFSGNPTGDHLITESTTLLGTHGFLSSSPRMQATFVAAGAGIRQGVKLGVIENIQVAPTVARLLNIELKSATGQPLDEILTAAP